MRELCPACNKNPVAVNYIRKEKTHYRNVCSSCARKGKKIKSKPPMWYQAGFRKKPTCDRCAFKAETDAQLLVYHLDGDLNNNNRLNLKTVCLNCRPIVTKLSLPWVQAKIIPDF